MLKKSMVKGWLAAAMVVGLSLPASAGQDEERLIGNLLTGLTGTQPASGATTSSAATRDQLVVMLSSGEYVTSRQGEPVDAMVAGVPLTHKDHVYVARPIAPAPTSDAPVPSR